MTDTVEDQITRLEDAVAELRTQLDIDDKLRAVDDKSREEHRKACEQVISLLDEVGAVEILRDQVPPYRRYLLDRLETALRLLPARPPNPIPRPAGAAGHSRRGRRSGARPDTAPSPSTRPGRARAGRA
jgi:hypothetical protein